MGEKASKINMRNQHLIGIYIYNYIYIYIYSMEYNGIYWDMIKINNKH